MSIQILILELVRGLTVYLGETLARWIEGLFKVNPETDKEFMIEPGALLDATAAPAEVRKKFGTMILDFVKSKLANYKVIARYVLPWLERNLDAVMDRVWDKFFEKEIAGGQLQALGGTTLRAFSSETLPESEVRACMVEAGLAA